MSHFQGLVKEALAFWFPKQELLENYKPEWLYGMELDFYLPKQKLAVEVQGHQHYRFISKIHGTKKEFYALKKRDKLKLRACHKQGITLLVVNVNNTAVIGGLPTKLCKHFGKAMPSVPDSLRNSYRNHLVTMTNLNTKQKTVNR